MNNGILDLRFAICDLRPLSVEVTDPQERVQTRRSGSLPEHTSQIANRKSKFADP